MESHDEPSRSAAKFAVAAGASAGALTLAVVGVPSVLALVLGVIGSLTVGPIVRLAIATACATAFLAFAEEHAARQVGRGRVVLGISSIFPVALTAALVALGHATWAAALWESGPDRAPVVAVMGLSLLERGDWEALLLASLLPTAVAMTRAGRSLTPGARVAIGGTTFVMGYGAILLTDGSRRSTHAELAAFAAGVAYFAGVSLGDRVVPERHPTTSVPLHAVAGPLLLPLVVANMLCAQLGPLATLPVVAWVIYQAVTYKRAMMRALPAELRLADAALPPWFDVTTLAAVEEDLLGHGLRRTSMRAAVEGVVQAIALGDGPTAALIYQRAPDATGAAAAPRVVFVTWFQDAQVATSGLPFDVLAWFGRSPLAVHDALPGATVNDLAARHAADVAALAALVGPPTGPGSAERFLAHEAAQWPPFVAKVRAVPALWLLACAYWFAAPRPVRLRGPLPA